MNKLTLATLILSTLTTGVAQADWKDWKVNSDGLAQAYSIEKNGTLSAQAIINRGKVFVSFKRPYKHAQYETCANGNEIALTVNGQSVQMMMGRRVGYCVYFPITDAGIDFVRNEFYSKSTVTWINERITAKGFTKAVNELKANLNPL
jgi:hypothetical protein